MLCWVAQAVSHVAWDITALPTEVGSKYHALLVTLPTKLVWWYASRVELGIAVRQLKKRHVSRGCTARVGLPVVHSAREDIPALVPCLLCNAWLGLMLVMAAVAVRIVRLDFTVRLRELLSLASVQRDSSLIHRELIAA